MVKLPARKFSLREREMLFGAGAPNDFFYQGEGSWVAPAAGFGAVVAAVVYIGMLRARKQVRAITAQLGCGRDVGAAVLQCGLLHACAIKGPIATAWQHHNARAARCAVQSSCVVACFAV